MVKFSDSSHNILKEYFDVLITPRTGTHNSFIQGQRRTISAQGGLDTTLYQKNDNGDFVAHRFLVQSIEDDNFKYQYVGQLSDHSEATELTAGQEMYFRKDSLFHDWLKVHATQYEQSINTNKTFIYFGKLYTVSGEEVFSNYNIIFDGMKNFVTEALPENNRTEKVVELLKVFFDEVYHDIYNMTKNLWSFFDAREVDIDHLNYLATRANIETDVTKISTELKLREFVDTLPWWLKRKGSYSSYLSLYKLLLGNTKNKLNFYERWSEWCLKFLRENEGIIYDTDFEDHHYLEFYSRTPTGGAGPFYYDQFNHVNYPTYTDTAPNENNCLENQNSCQILTTFDGFTGEDTGANLTQVGFNIQIDGFNSAAADDMYLYRAPAVSAIDFNHCMTVSMDNTAQPSGGIFIWVVSDHPDKTLDEHNTDNENWLGISFEVLGDTPSGAVTGRRFRIWDTITGTSTARDSSGSYNADTNYYLSIEKYQDELTLKVFNDERRRDQDLKEKIRLPLTENKGYNTIYIPNYMAAPVGCDWTGDISNWYTAAGNTNTIELSGNMILTPHYRVEIDLSSEPMGDDFIISEDQATELIRYWEYLKPVSKFVHYNWLLSPVGQIDENSKSIPLYAIRDTAFCNTQFLGQNYVSGSPLSQDFGPDGDWFNKLYIQEFLTSQDEWVIRHNLNTDELIIQTYNKDGFQSWPITHEFKSADRVDITWSDTQRGKVLVAELKPGQNYSHFQSTPASAWNINHNMGTSGASGVVFEVVSVSGAQDINLTEAAELDTHFDIGPVETWTRYFGTSAWSVSGGWTFNSDKNAYEATAENGRTFAVLEPAGAWANDFRRERIRVTFSTSGAGAPSGSWILNGDTTEPDWNVIAESTQPAESGEVIFTSDFIDWWYVPGDISNLRFQLLPASVNASGASGADYYFSEVGQNTGFGPSGNLIDNSDSTGASAVSATSWIIVSGATVSAGYLPGDVTKVYIRAHGGYEGLSPSLVSGGERPTGFGGGSLYQGEFYPDKYKRPNSPRPDGGGPHPERDLANVRLTDFSLTPIFSKGSSGSTIHLPDYWDHTTDGYRNCWSRNLSLYDWGFGTSVNGFNSLDQDARHQWDRGAGVAYLFSDATIKQDEKVYFELYIIEKSSGYNVGIGNEWFIPGEPNLNGYKYGANVGTFNTSAWGFGAGQKWNGSGTAYGGVWDDFDYLRFCVDMTEPKGQGKVWMTINDAAWPGGGDPENGTGAAFENVNSINELWILVSGTQVGDRVRTRFAQGEWTRSAPTGFNEISGLQSNNTSAKQYTPWIRIDNDPNAPASWTQEDVDNLAIGINFRHNPKDYKNDKAVIDTINLRVETETTSREIELTEFQLRNIEFWDNTVSAGKISFDTMPRKAESNILFEDRGIQPEFEFWFDYRITSAGRGIENKGGQVSLLTVSDVQIDDIRDLSRLPSGAYAVSLRAASLSGDMYMLLSDHSPSAEYITEWNIGDTSRGDSTSTDQLFIKFNRYTAWSETTQPAIVVEYYPNADRKETDLIYRQVHFLNSNGALLANNYTYALNAMGEIPSASEFYAYGPSGAFEEYFTAYDDTRDSWETNPANMYDGSISTYAQELASNADQTVKTLNTAFTLPFRNDVQSVKIRAHGLAGGPPTSWDLQPLFYNTPETSAGEYYRLRDNNIPMSDQSIAASGGTSNHLVRGIKPGKPNIGQGSGVRNGYWCAFDGDGNFWIQGRTSDYLNHINTQQKDVTTGIVYKCHGRSSWIDKIYEPSGAAGGTGSDFGGKHLGDGSSGAIWWAAGLFYNENTGRMGHSMQNSDTDVIRILEFSENAVDYPNQITYEKDLTIPGSWAANSVKGLTYDPINDNYIMNYNNILYVLDATTGAIIRQRACRQPAAYQGFWGLDVSGGVLFQQADNFNNTPWIYAIDPLDLTASKTVQPSAVNMAFRGSGYTYGGLAADKTTGNWYSGEATGTEWIATRKWSSDQLPANSLLNYSSWIDITNDPNAPSQWTLADVNALQVKNVFFENEDNDTDSVNYARTTQIELLAEFSPSGAEIPPSANGNITGYSQNWRQIYGDNPVIIIPARAQQVTKNDLKLTFSKAVDGKCFIRDDDYYHQQTVAATIWNINHNLNIAAAIIMCYDTDENLIFPKSIELVDADNTQIIFSEDTAGTAVFVIFQNEFGTGTFIGAFEDGGFWKAGDGGDEVGFNPLANNDINSILVSGTLDEFIETTSAASGSVLINFKVPTNGAYQFNEFGIFDGDKNLHYYTKNSNLYKPDGVSLNLRYRISKTAEV